jgi:hypothetical protein
MRPFQSAQCDAWESLLTGSLRQSSGGKHKGRREREHFNTCVADQGKTPDAETATDQPNMADWNKEMGSMLRASGRIGAELSIAAPTTISTAHQFHLPMHQMQSKKLETLI